MEKFTTVGDLIRELQKYDEGTPLLGFCYHDGFRQGTSHMSVLGVYPDRYGKYDSVQISFLSEDHNPTGKVEPTGEEWGGGNVRY